MSTPLLFNHLDNQKLNLHHLLIDLSLLLFYSLRNLILKHHEIVSVCYFLVKKNKIKGKLVYSVGKSGQGEVSTSVCRR